jgi:hypothetical protein
LHHMTEDEWYPWEESERGARKPGRAWLWIGLPLLFGVLLISGVIALVLNVGFGTTRIWADVSLVAVLLPLCILGFIPFIILIGLSYGVGRLVGWLPDPLQQVDTILVRVARETRRGADTMSRPMMAIKGLLAVVDTFLRGLIDIIR